MQCDVLCRILIMVSCTYSDKRLVRKCLISGNAEDPGPLQYSHYLSSDAPDYPFSEIFSKAWSHVCYVCIFYVPRYLVIIPCLTISVIKINTKTNTEEHISVSQS